MWTNVFRWLFVAIAVLAISGCAGMKPLENYSYNVPKTNKVSLVACYNQLGLFEGGLKPRTYFSKEIQEKNDYVVNGITNSLKKAGYQVTLNENCKDPWVTKNRLVKVTVLFTVMPIQSHGVLASVFVVPEGMKGRSIPDVIQIPYGDGTTHLHKVFPKVPPALISAIKKGQTNRLPANVP